MSSKISLRPFDKSHLKAILIETDLCLALWGKHIIVHDQTIGGRKLQGLIVDVKYRKGGKKYTPYCIISLSDSTVFSLPVKHNRIAPGHYTISSPFPVQV